MPTTFSKLWERVRKIDGPTMSLPFLFLPVLAAQMLVANKRKEKGRGVDTLSHNGRRFTTTDVDNETDMSYKAMATFCLPTFNTFLNVRAHALFTAAELRERGSPLFAVLVALYMSFCVFPAVDLLVKNDWANPTKEQIRKHRNDWKFRAPLFAFSVLSLTLTGQTLGALTDPRAGYNFAEKVAMVIMVALNNGGIGITSSHELLHKSTAAERIAGHALLTNVNYLHWGLEHTDGHHAHVSTPFDPASSRLGESLYAFLPRTFIGTVRSSLIIEAKRVRKTLGLRDEADGGPSMLSLLLNPFHSQALWWVSAPAAWACAIAAFHIRRTGGGVRRFAQIIGIFYAQGFLSATLLEIINYVEHYGLARKRLKHTSNAEYVKGDFEPVDPTHSWNSPARLSNTLLFKLQRHSDHHSFSKMPYHCLRNFEESPQLPTGYPGVVVLSVFPFLWRWVMDPLANAYNKQKELEAKAGDSSPPSRVALEEASRIAVWKMRSISGANLLISTLALPRLLRLAARVAQS